VDFSFIAGNGSNIEVKLDREMLLKGIDSQLESAVRCLEEKIRK
jgi:hydroxyethylthiazole kinase-like sugar kinase family protein